MDLPHVYLDITRIPKKTTHVMVPTSILEIRDEAFKDCNELKEVELYEGLKKIGTRAFANCTSLQSITLPSTLTEIEGEAFKGCTNLREIVLNEGLKKIGINSFYCCEALESITTPSTLIEIDHNLFDGCINLRKIVFKGDLKNIKLGTCWGCEQLTEVILNEGLRKIELGAFGFCESLERITIPSTVTVIGNRAFRHCIRLREIVFTGGVPKFGYDYEDTVICKTFTDCLSLERLKFSSSSSLSTRLDIITQAGQRDIEAKIDDIPGVEWQGGELVIPAVRHQVESQAGITEIAVDFGKKLAKVEGLIAHYEMKERTTLFELAIWKAMIDQAGETNDIKRDAYRIEVPGPVKNIILQYMSNE